MDPEIRIEETRGIIADKCLVRFQETFGSGNINNTFGHNSALIISKFQ